MNKYEILEVFIVGIDIGILTKDDLYDYVLAIIEEEDNPDPMYCEIALELSKDWKILRAILLGILHNEGYIYGFEQRVSKVFNVLIEVIGQRYEIGEITLKETVHLFYELVYAFDPHIEKNIDSLTELYTLEDDYDFAEMGILYRISDVEKSVRDILEENRNFLGKQITGGNFKCLLH